MIVVCSLLPSMKTRSQFKHTLKPYPLFALKTILSSLDRQMHLSRFGSTPKVLFFFLFVRLGLTVLDSLEEQQVIDLRGRYPLSIALSVFPGTQGK